MPSCRAQNIPISLRTDPCPHSSSLISLCCVSRRAILLWSTHDADRRGERGGHLFSTTTWGLANEWSVLSVTSPAACPAQCQLCCNGLTLSRAASSSPHSALSEVKVPHDLNRASSNKQSPRPETRSAVCTIPPVPRLRRQKPEHGEKRSTTHHYRP